VIIAWVGTKLLVEFLHAEGYLAFEIPKWLSLGLIVVNFGVSLLIAFRQERRSTYATSDAEQLLNDEGESR
jgi:hypothetical protein